MSDSKLKQNPSMDDVRDDLASNLEGKKYSGFIEGWAAYKAELVSRSENHFDTLAASDASFDFIGKIHSLCPSSFIEGARWQHNVLFAKYQEALDRATEAEKELSEAEQENDALACTEEKLDDEIDTLKQRIAALESELKSYRSSKKLEK